MTDEQALDTLNDIADALNNAANAIDVGDDGYISNEQLRKLATLIRQCADAL